MSSPPLPYASALPPGYVLIRRRTRAWLIGICTVLTLLLGAVATVVGLFALFVTGFGDPGGMPEPREPGQVALPVDGLGDVRGVASLFWADDEYVYLIDSHGENSSRVLQLDPDGIVVAELPFPELSQPQDIAVDRAGNVYVVDNPEGGAVVYKLAAEASEVVELPFAGVGFIESIAVGAEDETVYVAERGVDGEPGRVLQLRSWETRYTQLPIGGLVAPIGVGISDGGDLFVLDRGTRRLMEIYVGRDLSVRSEADLGDCDPTGLSLFGYTKYMTCDGGGLVVIRGDGSYAQAVEIDGSVIDIAASNGNWYYVALEGGSVITFVED